jgi:hypothetical protein
MPFITQGHAFNEGHAGSSTRCACNACRDRAEVVQCCSPWDRSTPTRRAKSTGYRSERVKLSEGEKLVVLFSEGGKLVLLFSPSLGASSTA